jgi:5-(carboxyamino)imidazole ribonucleotide mutase
MKLKKRAAQIAIVMGSESDWETMKEASLVLKEFDVPHACEVTSAHRTPKKMAHFAQDAEAQGIHVIIAGAGGAAHLPGMMAAHTSLPVLGVPVESKTLHGLDSLLSIAQMPAGVPVGCLAIGKSGAKNAALLAIAILALQDAGLHAKLKAFRLKQTQRVLRAKLPF